MMLFTVFGAFDNRLTFNRCTSSLVISSSRFVPNAGTRCTRSFERLSCDAARLLAVRHAVAFHESRRELFECRHLLDNDWRLQRGGDLGVRRLLAPPLARGLGRARRLQLEARRSRRSAS